MYNIYIYIWLLVRRFQKHYPSKAATVTLKPLDFWALNWEVRGRAEGKGVARPKWFDQHQLILLICQGEPFEKRSGQMKRVLDLHQTHRFGSHFQQVFKDSNWSAFDASLWIEAYFWKAQGQELQRSFVKDAHLHRWSPPTFTGKLPTYNLLAFSG